MTTKGPTEERRTHLEVARKGVQGGWVILGASGEIDIASAQLLDVALATEIEVGQRTVALDLTRVGFMDSTGLRSIIRAHRRLEALGGRIAVVIGSAGIIRRLFEVSGLMTVLEIVDSVEDLAEAPDGA